MPAAWIEKNLVCPQDLKPIPGNPSRLVCSDGHEYPCVDGIPALRFLENGAEKGLRFRDAYPEKWERLLSSGLSEETLLVKGLAVLLRKR